MPRWSKILLRTLAVLLVLGCGAGAFLWWKLRPRVEPIPETLAAAPSAGRSAELRVPGTNGRPDLVLAELRGETVLLVIEGRESMEAGEGEAVMSALNRWELPDDVAGFFVAELEGLGMFSFKIDDFIELMQRESRFPVYADYEGTILRGFELPKGHTGLVVLDPDGEVALRHTGPTDEAVAAELREALGAHEPDPLAPARPFSVGPLTDESCRGTPCAFAFLAEPVELDQVPGLEGGFDGDRDRETELYRNPSIRLVATFADENLAEANGRGAVLGPAEDVPFADGWTRLADDSSARARFGVPEDEAALVILDARGRLVFRELGLVPMYKLLYARDLLGLER